MNVSRLKPRCAAAATIVCACAIAAAAGASASNADKQDDVATITMELEGKNVFFDGPSSIDSGQELAIVNNTNPRQIGPHTFTLVEKSELPKSKQEIKDCEKFKAEFCLRILEAHKVNLKKETIGKPSVDVGKTGWDRSFGKKGDSWVAQTEGEEEDRVVSAKPGTKLFYFCLVHPVMQGKLKVK